MWATSDKGLQIWALSEITLVSPSQQSTAPRIRTLGEFSAPVCLVNAEWLGIGILPFAVQGIGSVPSPPGAFQPETHWTCSMSHHITTYLLGVVEKGNNQSIAKQVQLDGSQHQSEGKEFRYPINTFRGTRDMVRLRLTCSATVLQSAKSVATLH